MERPLISQHRPLIRHLGGGQPSCRQALVDAWRRIQRHPTSCLRMSLFASGRVEGNEVRVRWVIADGYYLYRQRIEIKAESPDLTLGRPAFPAERQNRPYFGSQEIYTQQVEATALHSASTAALIPCRSR
jgi:thiol:disulfide interchange protein